MSTQHLSTAIDALREKRDNLFHLIDATPLADVATLAQYDEAVSVLTDAINGLQSQLDEAECNAAREAAEARWQYHYDRDTIDLY